MLTPRGEQAEGLIFWAPLRPGVSGGVAPSSTARTEFVWPHGNALKYKTASPVVVDTFGGQAYEMKSGGTSRGWTQDNWKAPETLSGITVTARVTLNGSLTNYDTICMTRFSGGQLHLIASGATGHPLTCQMGSNVGTGTYFDAATGLAMPTDREFVAACCMNGTTMCVFLADETGIIGYYEWTGVTAYSSQPNFATNELGIGYDPTNGRYHPGTIRDVRIYSRGAQPWLIEAIAKRPQELWTPPTVVYFAPTTTATDLVVADASFPVSFDSPAISQVHELAAQDAFLPVAFDQVALTQVHQLTAQDATFPTTFDSPAITQLHELAVDDASLPTSFENVTLTQGQTLVVQDATLPVAFESPALDQVHSLTVADSALPVTFDSPGLTQAHQLAADDANIAVLFESPTLFQAHSLTADDATLPTLFDAVTLTTSTHIDTVAVAVSSPSVEVDGIADGTTVSMVMPSALLSTRNPASTVGVRSAGASVGDRE